MRHNPASGAIVIMLRSLKMHGMAQAVGELTEQGSPAFEAAIPILSQLLKAETAEREVRSTAYQLKTARFPDYRDLTGFDFASSEINEALVRQLHRGTDARSRSRPTPNGPERKASIRGPGRSAWSIRDGLPACAIPLSAVPSRCFTTIRRAAGPSKNSRAKPASHAPYLQRVSCASSAVRLCNISRDGACNSRRGCLPTGRTRSQRSRGRSVTSLRRRSVGASRGSRASRQPGGAPVGANSRGTARWAETSVSTSRLKATISPWQVEGLRMKGKEGSKKVFRIGCQASA